MIAEQAVFSMSSWYNDFNFNELDFPATENESRSIRGDVTPDLSSSCSPSSNSSECSDEHSLNVIFQNFLDADCMAGSFGLDWPDMILPELFLSGEPEIDRRESDPWLSPTKPRTIDPLMDNISWSSMELNEQLVAVEKLTKIISDKMGLREQLDIIRIIEPKAVISPTDTEFVIDLRALNDVKLTGVREYVKKALASQEESHHIESPEKSGSSSATSKCNSSTSTSGKSTTVTSTAKSKTVKKKVLKEKRATHKVSRQQQKKERQRAKENRSGLFAKEEVLALSTYPVVEDDTDIDILG